MSGAGNLSGCCPSPARGALRTATPHHVERLRLVKLAGCQFICVLEANEKQVLEMDNGFFHYVEQASLILGPKAHAVSEMMVGEGNVFSHE